MSPLGNEDARAQVGTNGGLSQRWRERAERIRKQALDRNEGYRLEMETTKLRADELDAAKLRIEEAVKALPAYLHRDDKDAGPLSVSSRTAVLKIIREIL